MKIIKYQCNICSELYEPEQAVKGKQVKAVYFKNMHDFELRDLPAETDRHICVRCLEQLRPFPDKQSLLNSL